MERVTGIGGVFFKSRDPKALGAWYQRHLGVPVEEAWGGAIFRWRDTQGDATTTWSPFKADTTYFEPSQATFMLNFRVESLDRMLAQLRGAGVQVMDAVEESEFGRFGWCLDPEGNKLELWEPPPGK